MHKPIEVFVRHCSHSPNSNIPNRYRPEWFDKTKVYRNLINTANHELCNINVIYDEHFGPYTGQEKSVVKINCGTEAKSFLATLDIILSRNLPDDTIIYLLEDDYLHKPGWCEILMGTFEMIGNHFNYITLYDHLDKYLSNYSGLQSQIFKSGFCHWRTTPSTCNTYACKLSQLKADIDIHRYYSENAYEGVSRDHEKFIDLGNRGRVLISSIPGYSTQCDQYQSPCTDWKQIMNLTQ